MNGSETLTARVVLQCQRLLFQGCLSTSSFGHVNMISSISQGLYAPARAVSDVVSLLRLQHSDFGKDHQ